MKKFITSVFVACVISLLPIISMAAPATLSPSAGSSSYDLIVVTNPPSFSSTTQRGVVFCGYGKSGTKVTLYIYDSGSGVYRQLTSYGSAVTTNINASGIFWKKVDFSSGNKKVIIYAENNGNVQIVKREINVLNPNLADKIKDYTVNITNELQFMGR